MARQRNEAVALGRVIGELRAEFDYSRPDLAKVAGLSYPYLYEIEKGTKYPKAEALEKIAAALEVSPQELIERQVGVEKSLPRDPEGAATPRSSSNLGASRRPVNVDHADDSVPADLISAITQDVLQRLAPAVKAAVAEALRAAR